MQSLKHGSAALVSALLVGVNQVANGGALLAKDVQPRGYNTPIPEDVLTPDSVRTRLGTFRYFDGFPDQESSQKARRICLLYTSPSPRDATLSRMPSSA